MQSNKNTRWYFNPWGWWSMGINLFLAILALIFPRLLGGEPYGMENTRIHKIVAFISYPIGLVIYKGFEYIDKFVNESNSYNTIKGVVTFIAFLIYWYLLGLLLAQFKKMLSPHSIESQKL